MHFAIHSIGDSAFLASILNGVAMIFGNGNFVTLISIGLLLGVFAIMLQSLFRGAKEIQWQQILLGWIIYGCMFAPTCTVVIEDAYSGKSYTVDNVPVGVGFAGSMISCIGYGVTALFEQAYGDVAGLTTQPFVEPLKILNSVRHAASEPNVFDAIDRENRNANLRLSLLNYVQECTMPKLALHQTTADALINNDAFAELQFSSSIYGTLINTDGSWKNLTCTDAWPKITQALNAASRVSGTIAGNIGLEGRNGAAPDLNQSIADAIQFLGNVASSSQNYIKLSLIEPIFMKAQASFYRNVGDAASALMLSQAIEQRNAQWAAEASMFQTTVRPFLAFFEGFIFAVTPILAFLIVTGGIGMMLAVKYVQLIAWIQLWYPVLSIVNLYTVMAATNDINTLKMTSDSFYALNKTTEVLQTWIATGGMLAAATPLIALFLVTGSTYAFTTLTGRMQGGDHLNEKIASPDALQPNAYYAGETVGHGNAWSGTVRTGAEDMIRRIDFGRTASAVVSSAATKAANSMNQLSEMLSTSYSDSQMASDTASVARTLGRSMSAEHNRAVDAARSAIKKTSWGQQASNEQVDQLIGALGVNAGANASFSFDTSQSAVGKFIAKVLGASARVGGSAGSSGTTTSQAAAAEKQGTTEAQAQEIARSLRSVDSSGFKEAAQSALQHTSQEQFTHQAGVQDNELVSHTLSSAISDQKNYVETASEAKTFGIRASMASTSLAGAVLRSSDAARSISELFTDQRMAAAADERAKAMDRAGVGAGDPLFAGLSSAERSGLLRTAAMLEVLNDSDQVEDKQALMSITNAAMGTNAEFHGDARRNAWLQGPSMRPDAGKLHADYTGESAEAAASAVDRRIGEEAAVAAAGNGVVQHQVGLNSAETLAGPAAREKKESLASFHKAVDAFKEPPPNPPGIDKPVRMDSMTEVRRQALKAHLTPAQANLMEYALGGAIGHISMEENAAKALLAENQQNLGKYLSSEEIQELTANQVKYADAIAGAGDKFEVYLDKFQNLNNSLTMFGETPHTGEKYRLK